MVGKFSGEHSAFDGRVMKTVLVILCFFGFLQGEEVPQGRKTMKYTLSVCAVFKNEAKYLKEWIEYHRIIGVDHFYLYSNNSADDFRKVVNPYLLRRIVTLISWPDNWKDLTDENMVLWILGTQIPAYENAVYVRALKETKWLVFLDVNEYLVPGFDRLKITDILQEYENACGVEIPTLDCFDASRRTVLPKRKLLIETIERVKTSETDALRLTPKLIVKPALCAGFSWPPYQCGFKPYKVPVKLKKGEIEVNRYLNREKIDFGKNNKISALHKPLSGDQMKELLDSGCEVEDPKQDVLRFVPELLKRMGY